MKRQINIKKEKMQEALNTCVDIQIDWVNETWQLRFDIFKDVGFDITPDMLYQSHLCDKDDVIEHNKTQTLLIQTIQLENVELRYENSELKHQLDELKSRKGFFSKILGL